MGYAEHKEIYVKWPGGNRTGPHTQTFKDYENDVEVWIDERSVIIPGEWCEPAEPELEEGRLYYRWDNNGVGRNSAEIMPFGLTWDNIEPVHRRWNELSEDERTNWFVCDNDIHEYKYAYKLITGEEHP